MVAAREVGATAKARFQTPKTVQRGTPTPRTSKIAAAAAMVKVEIVV